MKVTRDVITDLLPTYLASEASSDTQALVEEFFKLDPEFAGIVKDKKSEDVLRQPPAMTLPEDHERETLIRARNMLKWRAHWLTMAIIVTIMAVASATVVVTTPACCRSSL